MSRIAVRANGCGTQGCHNVILVEDARSTYGRGPRSFKICQTCNRAAMETALQFLRGELVEDDAVAFFQQSNGLYRDSMSTHYVISKMPDPLTLSSSFFRAFGPYHAKRFVDAAAMARKSVEGVGKVLTQKCREERCTLFAAADIYRRTPERPGDPDFAVRQNEFCPACSKKAIVEFRLYLFGKLSPEDKDKNFKHIADHASTLDSIEARDEFIDYFKKAPKDGNGNVEFPENFIPLVGKERFSRWCKHLNTVLSKKAEGQPKSGVLRLPAKRTAPLCVEAPARVDEPSPTEVEAVLDRGVREFSPHLAAPSDPTIVKAPVREDNTQAEEPTGEETLTEAPAGDPQREPDAGSEGVGSMTAPQGGVATEVKPKKKTSGKKKKAKGGEQQ